MMAAPIPTTEVYNLKIYIDGMGPILEKLSSSSARLRKRLVAATGEAATVVRDAARKNVETKFNNPATMMEAIQDHVEITNLGAIGRVVASGLPYLAAHEFGVTFTTPAMTPKRGRALRFIGEEGEEVFTPFTRAHETTLPPRPYMTPAFEDTREEVARIFDDVAEGLF